MTSTPERRLAIRNYLSQARSTTIEYLMSEFGASKSTIRRDLDYLETELSVPIERIPGNRGGIRVFERWYAGMTYLSDKQEDFLRSLMPSLSGEQKAMMEDMQNAMDILSRLAKKAKMNVA